MRLIKKRRDLTQYKLRVSQLSFQAGPDQPLKQRRWPSSTKSAKMSSRLTTWTRNSFKSFSTRANMKWTKSSDKESYNAHFCHFWAVIALYPWDTRKSSAGATSRLVAWQRPKECRQWSTLNRAWKCFRLAVALAEASADSIRYNEFHASSKFPLALGVWRHGSRSWFVS